MENFYENIYKRQLKVQDIPSNKRISEWIENLLYLLFPERNSLGFSNVEEVSNAFKTSENELLEILVKTKACSDCDNSLIVKNFFENLPNVYKVMNTDSVAIMEGDPAAKSIQEVVRTYPGFTAICIYRIAHQLWKLKVPMIPRILTEYSHSITGIDIHPGAKIGEYLHIDHGTGIVVGETCVIGNHVKLYQGVTLGALSVEKDMANMQRHPIIENNVIIYAGATILGGETVIGHNSVIGGNVWLTSSVEPHTIVYHNPTTKFVNDKKIKF